MTDLQLAVGEAGADLVLEGGDLALDLGLEAPALLSLFTDRRARELPAGEADPRGFWADTADDRWGSLLWLLDRSKRTRETAERARAYVRESLAWLVEDGLLERVEVEVDLSGSVLALEARLVRGTATRWPSVWAGVQAQTYSTAQGLELHLLPI